MSPLLKPTLSACAFVAVLLLAGCDNGGSDPCPPLPSTTSCIAEPAHGGCPVGAAAQSAIPTPKDADSFEIESGPTVTNGQCCYVIRPVDFCD